MSLLSRNVGADSWRDEALADERASLTWQEADGILNRATNGILAEVSAQRRVGVFARNCVEQALAHTATLAAGRSSVPINSFLAASELAYVLEDGAVDLLFVGPECMEAALGAVGEIPRVRIVGWRCDDTSGVTSWIDWLAQQPDIEPTTNIRPRPHLHYTSGTTGRPKAVETPPNMFPTCDTVTELFDALGAEVRAIPSGVCLAAAPLYHTSPMRLIRAFAGGAKLVTMDHFDPEQFLAEVEKHRVERSVMVPTHFRRLLALDEKTRRSYDVSSLQYISHTGAACPVDVKEQMIEWIGPVLVEFYGGTETGPAAKIDSREALEHPGSVGRAAAPFEAVIIGEDEQELPPGSEGKLYFRDTSGRGIIYVNDPEKTRQAHIAPATFTLGDVGYVDEDGFVFITDRATDMIVSGGVNIYPAEVEQVLIGFAAIEDVAVIGVPNADMGEEVKALIVLKPGIAQPVPGELDRHCRNRLAGFKCPRSYAFVASIGRNAMGKVSKRELRRPYWPTERTIG
ncbi:MAG: AMP-binding protein [Sphingomonadaceae bacterium]|nr:AMP-binding protein [Sphingomonadaceae bacterium]